MSYLLSFCFFFFFFNDTATTEIYTLSLHDALPISNRCAAGDRRPSMDHGIRTGWRSEEHTSELQSHSDLVCRLLLEKKKNKPLSDYHRQNAHFLTCIKTSKALLVAIFLDCIKTRKAPNAEIVLGHFSSFFFNDTATTEIYTLSLHDALPICLAGDADPPPGAGGGPGPPAGSGAR